MSCLARWRKDQHRVMVGMRLVVLLLEVRAKFPGSYVKYQDIKVWALKGGKQSQQGTAPSATEIHLSSVVIGSAIVCPRWDRSARPTASSSPVVVLAVVTMASAPAGLAQQKLRNAEAQ